MPYQAVYILEPVAYSCTICTLLYDCYKRRMAPEVIACDENLGATYDNRVCS